MLSGNLGKFIADQVDLPFSTKTTAFFTDKAMRNSNLTQGLKLTFLTS
jgi:hypothetical protein